MRVRRTVVGVVLAGGLLGFPVATSSADPPTCVPGQYTYQELAAPGAGQTQARDINNAGTVVGSYGTDLDSVLGTEVMPGFSYASQTATWSTVTFPYGAAPYASDPSSYVTGINDAGSLSGYSGRFNQSGFAVTQLRGVRRVAGVDSPVLDPGVVFANGINGDGHITGFWVDGVGKPHAFIDRAGVVEDIDIPTALNTYVSGIGTDDETVGVMTFTSGPAKGFVRDADGSVETIDVPCGAISGLEERNAVGELVGSVVDGTGGHGFVRRPGGSHWLLDVPGADETRAFGINDAGVVVGDFIRAGAYHGFIATPFRTETKIEVDPIVAKVLPGLRVSVPRLSARVTDIPSGTPIAGTAIVFEANGRVVCVATTDANGRATCSGLQLTVAGLVSLGYKAHYAGDDFRAPVSGKGPILVVGPLRIL
jgi:hypothetical protein